MAATAHSLQRSLRGRAPFSDGATSVTLSLHASASADRPSHWFEFQRRRLGRRHDLSGGRHRSNLISATTIGKDQRRAARLARHHRPQFRPFPARRAADFYDHHSFSARSGRRAHAVRGQCRDRDRFSAHRTTLDGCDLLREPGCASRNLARVRSEILQLVTDDIGGSDTLDHRGLCALLKVCEMLIHARRTAATAAAATTGSAGVRRHQRRCRGPARTSTSIRAVKRYGARCAKASQGFEPAPPGPDTSMTGHRVTAQHPRVGSSARPLDRATSARPLRILSAVSTLNQLAPH